ncbi:hypothetical protein [Psychrobacillus sp. FSL K6-1267]|uniref:hypothetical protein n=1 Tax=Psychrobacillus sp. FSL K6-1267 TaxID=2921543 RepID=UPI0030FAFED0
MENITRKSFLCIKNIYPLGEKVDVITTITLAKRKREDKVVITTFDGLGVIGKSSGERYEFLESQNSDAEELLRMRQFLQEATLEEKQAFIRDIQYWYIVDPDYNMRFGH